MTWVYRNVYILSFSLMQTCDCVWTVAACLENGTNRYDAAQRMQPSPSFSSGIGLASELLENTASAPPHSVVSARHGALIVRA